MATTEARDVALTIPAKAGYLVLARLALAAVCRLTTLTPSEIADLKLAVTEAAGDYVPEDEDHDRPLAFDFELGAEQLTIGLTGTDRIEAPDDEQDLRYAIIEATVDEVRFDGTRTELIKRLG